MKWLVTVMLLNGGLLLVCFGLMARQNACEKTFAEAFFGGGAISLVVAAIIFISILWGALIEWFVRRRTLDTRTSQVSSKQQTN